MLKRKKNEGLVAYFERWADQKEIDSDDSQRAKWGPSCVSTSLYEKMNKISK
jgi:hypothetical protein